MLNQYIASVVQEREEEENGEVGLQPVAKGHRADENAEFDLTVPKEPG